MEKKLITIALIALLGGLGGGYGLSYVTYQPQIQNLQNQATNQQNGIADLQDKVGNLNSTIETMENKAWYFVVTFTLDPPDTERRAWSSTFNIEGEKWRTKWDMGNTIGMSGGYAGFTIYDASGYIIDNIDLDWMMSGRDFSKGIYYVHQGEGTYYIEQHGLVTPVNYIVESYN